MKLLFSERRIDKNNSLIQYEAGKVYEFDDKRGAEILGAANCCAVRIDDEKTNDKPTPKKTRKSKE